MTPEAGGARPGGAGAPSIGSALLRLALALTIGYAGLGLGLSYWQVLEAQRLTTDPGNPLVLAAARNAPRGRILDATGTVVARSVRGANGERVRQYPHGVMTPVVGYKSLIFGSAGLERAYDAELTGLSQFGPADDFLRKFRTDPYDPNDLVLSIDLRLQARAAQLLGDDRGAVVAIEPATGRVLALVSAPTFDPNRLVDPARGRAYLETLQEGPADASPLLNRATQGRYVPGSVFKIVTAVAALGSGSITAETTYPEQPGEEEEGYLIRGFRVQDGHHDFTSPRPLDFVGATEVSCNIYYARAGVETGGPALIDWAGRLGFGEPIPFDLPTEPSQVTGGNGPGGGFRDEVELANAAYGQGEILSTPLQMALVAATVANDGVMMRPKLVDRLESESGTRRDVGAEALRRVIEVDDAAVIQRAMQAAVEGEFGRRFAGGAKVPRVPTAGKSGSAELGDRQRPHSWFIGFAPVEKPRIAIAVFVEEGGFGRERAVPLAGALMSFYLGLPAPG